MNTTMKDVARLAGVSATTVSHVINDTRPVRHATRRRVVEAIRECNYAVNPVARNLRCGSSRVIGFVASNLSNYFYMEVARGLIEVFNTAGYNLIFVNSYEDPAIERANIEKFLRYSVDGLIVVPTQNDCRYLNDLVPTGLPIVFIDRKPKGFTRDFVLATNRQGSLEAVRLLVAKGHREIAFVASRENETIDERLQGYLDALREGGVHPDSRNIYTGVGDPVPLQELKEGAVYELTGHLLRAGRVTAIFCANNLATVGVYNKLRERQVPIPDKMALISFDDSFWFSMATPAITAVAQSPLDFGERAAHLLMDRLSGDESSYIEDRVQTQLVVRDSC